MRSSHGPRSCVARQPEVAAESGAALPLSKHDACQPHKPLIPEGDDQRHAAGGVWMPKTCSHSPSVLRFSVQAGGAFRGMNSRRIVEAAAASSGLARIARDRQRDDGCVCARRHRLISPTTSVKLFDPEESGAILPGRSAALGEGVILEGGRPMKKVWSMIENAS